MVPTSTCAAVGDHLVLDSVLDSDNLDPPSRSAPDLTFNKQQQLQETENTDQCQQQWDFTTINKPTDHDLILASGPKLRQCLKRAAKQYLEYRLDQADTQCLDHRLSATSTGHCTRRLEPSTQHKPGRKRELWPRHDGIRNDVVVG